MRLSFQIGRRTFRNISELKPVEFASGVLNGEPYLGFWQDVEVEEDGTFIDVDTIPILIFKDKQIPYTSEYLYSLGAKKVTTPVVSENWWSGHFVPVNPKKYFEEVYNSFEYYIDAPPDILKFSSVWTVGTVFVDFFQAYPYFFVNGVKRVGKTKILTVSRCMAFAGIKTHSMTEANIYRLVESSRATIYLDEQDYLANQDRRAEFRTLLLGGYKKGSFVYRNEKTSKGKIIPTRFKIYSAKSLANIEGLEDVLRDRTINITLLRSRNQEILRREPDEDDPVWLDLRDQLASLYINYWKDIKDKYRIVKNALGDTEDLSEIPDYLKEVFKNARNFIYSRNRELWMPPIAIALFFEEQGVEGLVESIIKVAEENIKTKEVDEAETPEVAVVYAVAKKWYQDGYYPLSEIVEAFRDVTGVEKIRPESIGRMLSRIGFNVKSRRVGKTYYYLTESKIRDISIRLGVDLDGTELNKKKEKATTQFESSSLNTFQTNEN